jgi:hypothetical protein
MIGIGLRKRLAAVRILMSFCCRRLGADVTDGGDFGTFDSGIHPDQGDLAITRIV